MRGPAVQHISVALGCPQLTVLDDAVLEWAVSSGQPDHAIMANIGFNTSTNTLLSRHAGKESHDQIDLTRLYWVTAWAKYHNDAA